MKTLFLLLASFPIGISQVPSHPTVPSGVWSDVGGFKTFGPNFMICILADHKTREIKSSFVGALEFRSASFKEMPKYALDTWKHMIGNDKWYAFRFDVNGDFVQNHEKNGEARYQKGFPQESKLKAIEAKTAVEGVWVRDNGSGDVLYRQYAGNMVVFCRVNKASRQIVGEYVGTFSLVEGKIVEIPRYVTPGWAEFKDRKITSPYRLESSDMRITTPQGNSELWSSVQAL